MEINFTVISILIGITLDTLIGDPHRLPHPVRALGNMISFFEKRLNRPPYRVIKGIITWFLLITLVFSFFGVLQSVLAPYKWILSILNGIFFFYCISTRCLVEEGLKVEGLLEKNDIKGARKQLSMIVGRDTDNLPPSKIRSAVVETLSENLSDGVVAPLFFFVIGGIPLMMVYKMINTLDSMVGYKNEKYKDFGFFSAKADDVANFIPARLTALLMIFAEFSKRGLIFIFRYGRCHSSPNSGYPESALAGILNCRLGGPNEYFGKRVEKPYIGDNPRGLTHRDVIKSSLINIKVACLAYLLLIFIMS